MNTLARGGGGGGEAPSSHYAPPLITATIGRYLAIYKRGSTCFGRTTTSVLTHLDSSTFARPLWAKNIKISFIAASLCVSLYRCVAPPVTPPPPPARQLIATWHFYFIRSSGDSQDTCQWRHNRPAPPHDAAAIYRSNTTTRFLNSTPRSDLIYNAMSLCIHSILTRIINDLPLFKNLLKRTIQPKDFTRFIKPYEKNDNDSCFPIKDLAVSFMGIVLWCVM